MKNILFTAFFSITILTLFFAPSGTNLAFAGFFPDPICEFECSIAAGEFFDDCLITNPGQILLCDSLAFSFFNSCVGLCPPAGGECQFDFDCGLPSECSQFMCDLGQCINLVPDGSPCGPGDACNDEVCLNLACVQLPIQDGTQCGTIDACERNVCEAGLCSQSSTACDDGDVCTIDSCDPASGCQTEPDPVCAEVGGVIVPLENTSLLVAGAQSFSWMIPVVLSVLGIGLFIVSRKSE